jgi:hypothetical protein
MACARKVTVALDFRGCIAHRGPTVPAFPRVRIGGRYSFSFADLSRTVAVTLAVLAGDRQARGRSQ